MAEVEYTSPDGILLSEIEFRAFAGKDIEGVELNGRES
jgi:hypothetical protein